MRLVTHNMLKCNVKGVKRGYPLKLEVKEAEIIETDFNPSLVKNMLYKIDWAALKQAVKDCELTGLNPYLDFSNDLLDDDEFLKAVHFTIFEYHVMEGELMCPESGRKFQIKDGIPNMVLHEDEV